MPIGLLHVLSGKMFRSFLLIFLMKLFGFFYDELYELCTYFEYQPLIGHIICKYFLPFSRPSFILLMVFIMSCITLTSATHNEMRKIEMI